jgi:hypothetical protein
MTDDKLPGYPSVLGILERLDAAGATGMLSKDLALSFRLRPRGLHATQVEVNTCLDKLCQAGRVLRGGLEPSPYYHGSPAFRWYITPAGTAHLKAGGLKGKAAARRAVQARSQDARDQAARQRADAEARARVRVQSLAPGCTRERNEVIRELRATGLTLAFIGALLGITRERTRQVLASIRVRQPCRCPRCRALLGPVVYPVVLPAQ